MPSLSTTAVCRWPCALLSHSRVVLLVCAVTSADAGAYESWSADDPIIEVAGHLADIQVQQPTVELAAMRLITLTVIVPRTVQGAVVIDDVSAFPLHTTVSATGPSWNGKGAIPLHIVVEVQAAASWLPRRLQRRLPAAR